MQKAKETAMLDTILSLLPGYTSTCRTAQHKSVQHHAYDTPKEYWCCWVNDEKGKKLFAMYDDSKHTVKTVTEDVKNKWVVKQLR